MTDENKMPDPYELVKVIPQADGTFRPEAVRGSVRPKQEPKPAPTGQKKNFPDHNPFIDILADEPEAVFELLQDALTRNAAEVLDKAEKEKEGPKKEALLTEASVLFNSGKQIREKIEKILHGRNVPNLHGVQERIGELFKHGQFNASNGNPARKRDGNDDNHFLETNVRLQALLGQETYIRLMDHARAFKLSNEEALRAGLAQALEADIF